MPGPLDGLLVVDASWGMPGAVGTMLLADYGAEVVKVERPDGPLDANMAHRRVWDRSKSSVTLDLDQPSDIATLLELLQRADIFVESFGVDRAPDGLGSAEIAELAPTLVHVSLSAYGHDGPWRDRPGYEALVAARMGFMAEQPGHRKGPIFLGHRSIGYTTGLLAGIGALAAIRARRFTGRGQVVDVSLLDGVLGQAPMNWWWNEKGESYLATEAEGTFGRRRTMMDMFLCADDEYIMIHTGGQGSFKATMDVLGLGARIKSVQGKLEMSVPLDDDEYEVTRTEVPAAFRRRPRAEWLDLLHAADVAAVPVLRPGEVLDHEQVRFAGVPVDVEDPEFGTTRQLGPGIRFAAAPSAAPVRAPRVGEHNDRLPELLKRPLRNAPTTPSGTIAGALDGVKILDFSSFFAAGYGAKYLSDLGADVIKVEHIAGDQMRPLPDPFEASQRGKRDIAIDLKSPEALAIVRDLVADADIVLHNLRPGKAEKLGIDYDALKPFKADLIYCYQPGWGSDGPSKNLKSFAPLMSALTGLMVEAAGEGNRPVRRARASEDYYSGLLVANAMLMALEYRSRTGEGQYFESPQLHASLFTASHQIRDANGELIPDCVLDHDQMGFHPLYRLYTTSDGYLCLAALGSRARAALGTALGVDTTVVEDELAAPIAAALAELPTAEAFDLLDRNGVPCEVALTEPFMPQFFWEEWASESGRVFEHYHEQFGWIREVGLTVRLSATPGRSKGPAPLLGEHSAEILGEIGYDHDRVRELLAGPVFDPKVSEPRK
jgi:crotonobetainyl-CoA:carnitine CoA-transferase CaiB-like acyl-CoA transferase